MPHNAGVPYSEDVTAEDLNQLNVSFSVKDGLDHAKWTCPRCGASFDQSFSRNDPVYKFDVDNIDSPRGQGLLDLVCRCGIKHEGGEGKPGCGFAAQLPVKEAEETA
jgi:hypothetical protein